MNSLAIGSLIIFELSSNFNHAQSCFQSQVNKTVYKFWLHDRGFLNLFLICFIQFGIEWIEDIKCFWDISLHAWLRRRLTCNCPMESGMVPFMLNCETIRYFPCSWVWSIVKPFFFRNKVRQIIFPPIDYVLGDQCKVSPDQVNKHSVSWILNQHSFINTTIVFLLN